MGGPGPGWPASDERVVETFRSGSPRALALVWWALSALALADIAAEGRDRESVVIALLLLATDAALYAGAWRPGLLLHRHHLVVRGSARDTALRLADVTAADARGALRVRLGERTVTSAIVSGSSRETRKAALRGRPLPGGLPSAGGLASPGGLGRGGRAPAPQPGRSRVDPQTADAAAGATQAGYTASRVLEEADRSRRSGGGPADAPPVVTAWVLWPSLVTAVLLVAAVLAGTA